MRPYFVRTDTNCNLNIIYMDCFVRLKTSNIAQDEMLVYMLTPKTDEIEKTFDRVSEEHKSSALAK